MKINTIEYVTKHYTEHHDWDAQDENERKIALEKFPFSLVVEGNYPEADMAIEYCVKNFGDENGTWMKLWYGKTDYDYGFYEFCFKEEQQLISFKSSVDDFFVIDTGGNWKSDGPQNRLSLA
jgi:hypothetical protein